MAKIRIVPAGANAAFSPGNLVIPAFEIVHWHNTDAQNHQISLNGQILQTGQSSDGILIPASTTYNCFLHPGETGSITIQAAPQAAGPSVLLQRPGNSQPSFQECLVLLAPTWDYGAPTAILL